MSLRDWFKQKAKPEATKPEPAPRVDPKPPGHERLGLIGLLDQEQQATEARKKEPPCTCGHGSECCRCKGNFNIVGGGGRRCIACGHQPDLLDGTTGRSAARSSAFKTALNPERWRNA